VTLVGVVVALITTDGARLKLSQARTRGILKTVSTPVLGTCVGVRTALRYATMLSPVGTRSTCAPRKEWLEREVQRTI